MEILEEAPKHDGNYVSQMAWEHLCDRLNELREVAMEKGGLGICLNSRLHDSDLKQKMDRQMDGTAPSIHPQVVLSEFSLVLRYSTHTLIIALNLLEL